MTGETAISPDELKACSDNWELFSAILKANAHKIRTGSFTVHLDASGRPSKVNLQFDGWRK